MRPDGIWGKITARGKDTTTTPASPSQLGWFLDTEVARKAQKTQNVLGNSQNLRRTELGASTPPSQPECSRLRRV